MESEFKQRVKSKRDCIGRMRLKAKEQGLTEALMICERCSLDIAPSKTFDLIEEELHYAKCIFGSLSRLELAEA